MPSLAERHSHAPLDGMLRLLSLLVVLAVPGLSADSNLSVINTNSLLEHTRILASDDFEGRAPGSRGEDVTVQYLVDRFRSYGLAPGMPDGTWTQPVPIIGVKSEALFHLGPEALTLPQDYVLWSPRTDPEVTVTNSEMVFVGYGVVAPEYGWDDFKGVDVRGKTVLILVGDPPVPDPGDPSKLDPNTFKGRAMTYYGRWTYKFEEAARKGAAAAIIIHDARPAAYPWFVVVNSWGRERFQLEADREPKVAVAGWMSIERARRVLATNGLTYEGALAAAVRKDFQPVLLSQTASFVCTQTNRFVKSRNVAARLEGSDPRLRQEWVIYTAHWDHLGRDPKLDGDQIFNGAADNALGTAGLLQLAEAFSRASNRPPRSVLFLAVTAEEQGLLGSLHYAANPPYPLTKTLANLNMDGLNTWGRTRDIRLVGPGSSSLEDVLRTVANRSGRVVMDEEHPERGTFYRSDHFEFMKQGVPALYLKAGTDYRDHPAGYGEARVNEYIDRDYHKVSDDVKPGWDLSGAVEDLGLLMEVGLRVATEPTWPRWREGSEFKARRDAQLSGAR
jgi:Zn-dependent M28 family amino/carboxypeptidase